MTLSAVAAESTHTLAGLSSTVPPGATGLGAGSPLVDIHPALNAVRHMPEFQPPKPNWLNELLKQPLIQQLQKSLGHGLEEIMKAIGHLLGQVRPMGINHLPENIREVFRGFIGFLVVLLALYALYIILGWLVRRRERHALPPHTEARRFEETLLINSSHHYAQAQQAAQKHQYPEALRQLYMASLCLLDEQALVPYTVTRSNLEYLQSLELAATGMPGSPTELKAAFAELARRFEAARYGNQPVDSHQFAASQAQYNLIQRMAVTHG